jgi:hypothetical protein
MGGAAGVAHWMEVSMHGGFRCITGVRVSMLNVLLLLSVQGLLPVSPAAAQAPAPPDKQPSPPREIIIGGQPPPAQGVQQCVDVEIGGDHAFGCLNQQLRREADRVNPTSNAPPLDARSPDPKVGIANEAAIRQQYGPNYGRSVVPFRPPPAAAVIPHR